MKTRIKKETWTKLIVIKCYQDFLREWLQLYDAYMDVNPPIDVNLEDECMFQVVKGLIKKYLFFLDVNTNIDKVQRVDDIKNVITTYYNAKL